jgi:hypothetical protein
VKRDFRRKFVGILTDSGSGVELERVHLPESQVSETIRPTTRNWLGQLHRFGVAQVAEH